MTPSLRAKKAKADRDLMFDARAIVRGLYEHRGEWIRPKIHWDYSEPDTLNSIVGILKRSRAARPPSRRSGKGRGR